MNVTNRTILTNSPSQLCNGLESKLNIQDPSNNSKQKAYQLNDSSSTSLLSPKTNLNALPPRLTTTPKKSMHVRALFDYDPALDNGLPSRGLSFRHGDILHVVNAGDREWWQARRLKLANIVENNISKTSNDNCTLTNSFSPTITNTTLTTSTGLGIIPSRQRIERRQQTRLKRVNFQGKITVIGSGTIQQHQQPANYVGPWNQTMFTDDTAGYSANNTFSSPNTNVTSSSILEKRPTNSKNKKQIETPPNDDRKKRSNSVTRNLLQCFSSRIPKHSDVHPFKVIRTGSLDTVSNDQLPIIRSYDLVVPITVNLPRPVVLLGPLKERVMDKLLENPHFTTCLSHTTKPPGLNERDGVNYYFVASRSQMELDVQNRRYIDVHQYQEHLYGISLDAICSVLKSGKICVLIVTMDDVKILDEAGLFPLAILLKPQSIAKLRMLQRRLTEDQAKRHYELALRLEADYWRFLSTIITFDNIDDTVNEIEQFVQLHNGPVIWISSVCSAYLAKEFVESKSNAKLFGTLVNNNGSMSNTLPRSPKSFLINNTTLSDSHKSEHI